MQTKNRLQAAIHTYNSILQTVREKGSAGEDGYGAVAQLDYLRKMLQQENEEHPDRRLCILLSDLCRAQYRGLEAQTYLERAIALSSDEIDRERWQQQAAVLNISWHRLSSDLSENCRKIAFDLDNERCVVAWQREDKDQKRQVGIAVFERVSGARISAAKLEEEVDFTGVFLCGDTVYLCGLKGMAFDTWTLERMPERDGDCPPDSEKRTVSREIGETEEGMHTLPVWLLHTSEDRQGQRWAGQRSMPAGDPSWNALQAKLPAVGLHLNEYAVTTDRTGRYLLLFKRPYMDPSDKRAPILPAGKPYFTIYDTTLFGTLPEDACFDAETFDENTEGSEEGNLEEFVERTTPESGQGDRPAADRSGLRRVKLLGSRRGKWMPESEIYTRNNELPVYHLPGSWQNSRSGISLKRVKSGTGWRCETSDGKVAAEFEPDYFSEDDAAFVYDPGEEILYSASLGVFAAWDVHDRFPCYMGAIDYIPACFSNVMAYEPASRPAGEPVTLRPEGTLYCNMDAWEMKPAKIYLNRPEHATLALLTGPAHNIDMDQGPVGFEIVTVIDLRTMRRIHHELFSRTHIAFLANGKTVGNGMVADVSEDGQVLLWKHDAGTAVWFVSEDGSFTATAGAGSCGSVLRADGNAYLSGVENPGGSCGKQEILLDWKYAPDTPETEMSPETEDENERQFKGKDPRTKKWKDCYPETLFWYLTRIRAMMERTEKEYAAEGKPLPEVDRRIPPPGKRAGFIPEIRMPFLIREIWVKDPLTVMHHTGLNRVDSVISKSLGEKGRFLTRFSGVLPTVKVLAEAPSEAICKLCIEAFIETLREYELIQEAPCR